MQIKTSDGGTSNVASQGLGVWGAVGGGLGTLALLNQGFLGGNGILVIVITVAVVIKIMTQDKFQHLKAKLQN